MKKTEFSFKPPAATYDQWHTAIRLNGDYIRLNLSSVQDLPEMLIGKSKELFNIDIKYLRIDIRFDPNVSNSHGCPINGVTNWGRRKSGSPTGYPGWYGHISFFAESEIYAGHTIWEGFLRGFHSGTGGPGSISQYKTDISFYFFIEDFPLLLKNFEKAKMFKSFQNCKKDDYREFNLKFPA